MIQAFAVAALVTLPGCVTSRQATQPVPMSPRTMQFFANWAANPTPGYFAVSKDGRYAYANYCPEFGGCAGANESNALVGCDDGAKGSECVIYGALGKPVVDDRRLKEFLANAKGDRTFGEYDRGRERVTTGATPPTTTAPRPDQNPSGRAPGTDQRLKALKDLFDRGLISKEAYEAKQKDILSSL